MRAKLLYMVLLLFSFTISAMAQQRTITGKVTDEKSEPIPGVSVFVKGTTIGTTTSAEGSYTLNVNDGATLVFQSIGFIQQEIAVGASNTIDVQLQPDSQTLTDVVLTGTADGMAKEKVPFGISTVDQKLIQQVPGVDAGQALQGKVAGVTVMQGAGPSGAPSIRFRGATQLTASNAPLVLVDGIITDGSIGDINSEDIYKIEAVKGASGASLYGSRAGNGVLQIITRKGQGLQPGETKVTFRNEYGSSSVIKQYPLATKTSAVFGADGNQLPGNAGTAADGLVDNDFPRYTNQQKKFFSPGTFLTNYLAVEGKSEKTGFLLSFQNMDREGVIKVNKGYQRRNLRLNLEHQLSKKLSISLSSAYVNSNDDFVQNGQGGPFFALTFMPPNANLEDTNPADGSPYRWDAARVAQPNALEINPLYRMSNNKILDDLNRFIGGIEARYDIFDWLTFSAVYGVDRENSHRRETFPVGYLPNSPSGTKFGRLAETMYNRTSQNTWLNAIIKKKFMEDLNTTFRLSFLREQSESNQVFARAQGFPVPGLVNLGAGADSVNVTTSNIEKRFAHNVFGAASFDYKDRYILDVLVRQDKSSLFGINNRSRMFYRVSGAYRISQDFPIEAINEWKLRASYGTSGQRPGSFDAQYETYTVNNGSVAKENLGNADLRPSTSKELEIGTDIAFLKRFNLVFNYVHTVTDDQILLAPLAANAGGYKAQWRNAGQLTGKVIELALNAEILKTDQFQWNAGLVFSRIRQKVTRLDIPSQRFGPGNNGEADSPPFFLREGENLGIMYGQRYARTPDDMKYVLGTNGQPVDASLYSQNADGLMVLTSSVGTASEAPQRMTNPDDKTLFWKIGDSNPNFNLALNSTFSWKGLSVYFLLDWKSGGDVYNLSKQWAIRELRHKFVDGGKNGAYYGAVSNFSTVPTDFFVEKGSYVKLRELNISYRFSKEDLMKMGDWAKVFREIRLGLVGRNLFMITNYSGVDPEVSSQPPTAPGASNNFDRTLFGYDAFGYPQFRTFSGFVTFSF